MRIALLTLISALGLGGCGGGDSAPDARGPLPDARSYDATMGDGGTAIIPEALPNPLPSGAVSIKLATYNAGLIATVKGAAERITPQVTALKALDVDVLCLQEIFNDISGPVAHAALLADTYPYAYWTWTATTVQSNGLLIVSKHPLYRGRELFYEKGNGGTTVNRMAIGVDVIESNDAWHAKVICTHLHAGLKTTDPATRLAEAVELTAWAATEGYTTGPTFLLGDFNAGPIPSAADKCECDADDSNPDTCEVCDLPDVDTLLELAKNFKDPFAESGTGDFFTQGYDQLIHMAVIPGLFPDEPSQRLDHCLYTGIGTSTFKPGTSGRVLDAVQSITAGGETLMWLSDHFGVRCEFGP